MAHLLQIAGPSPGQVFPLTLATCTIGRGDGCDLIVHDQSVSRRHLEVRLSGRDYLAEDLGSSNGTLLNGERMNEPTVLGQGDCLQLGDVEFLFHVSLSPTDSATDVNQQKKHQTFEVLPDKSSPAIYESVDIPLVSSSEDLHQQRIEALVNVSRRLSQSLSSDELIPLFLDDLFSLIPPAERATVVLCEEGSQFAVRWWKTAGEVSGDIQISRTIIRHVLLTQQAVTSNDVMVDSRFSGSETLEVSQIRSVMCAPLCDSEGGIMGVLQVDSAATHGKFEKDELMMLVSVATQMATAIHIGRIHERAISAQVLRRDLELAAYVQRSLLPESRPEVPGFRFFDFYQPAEHIGGDYFDYIPLARGRMAVIVADVSGHDVAAALRMARFSADARYLMAVSTSIRRVAAGLNQAASRHRVHDGEFITCLLMLIDSARGRVSIIRAGHEAPLLRRASGEVQEVGAEAIGPALGILDDPEFLVAEVRMQQDDVLMVYTDGVTDVMDSERRLFGRQRLIERLQMPLEEATCETVGQHVVEGLNQFRGECPQPDDICFVCAGRTDALR